MTRREALRIFGKTGLALLFERILFSSVSAAEELVMTTPNHIRHFTANNPGIMTLQGTNQYVVGKDNVLVIDDRKPYNGNCDAPTGKDQ